MAFQMLSQFMNMESVFLEVKRVLAPGGMFLFAEEPLKRMLTSAPVPLSLLRHHEAVGAQAIRLGTARIPGARRDRRASGGEFRHPAEPHHGSQGVASADPQAFREAEYEIFVPERGWGERIVKRAALRMDPHHSEWRAARLLGGTLGRGLPQGRRSGAGRVRRVRISGAASLSGLSSKLDSRSGRHAAMFRLRLSRGERRRRLQSASFARSRGTLSGRPRGRDRLLPAQPRGAIARGLV